jgi:hypothetical protein
MANKVKTASLYLAILAVLTACCMKYTSPSPNYPPIDFDDNYRYYAPPNFHGSYPPYDSPYYDYDSGYRYIRPAPNNQPNEYPVAR